MQAVYGKFLQSMKSIRGVHRGGSVAVALSGGVDSMVLLNLLVRYRHEVDKDVKIHAITVDHGIRPESSDEAKAVAATVSDYDIKHSILRIKEVINKQQLEKHARELRYKLLYDYCEKHDINDVFMGHHEDDQVETFTMRLMKGSTLFGLLGIRDVQMGNLNGIHKIDILRPLLGIRKSELYGYAKLVGVKWFEDSSNGDESLTARNAFRGMISKDISLREELVDLHGRLVKVFADTVYARMEELDKNGIDSLSGICVDEKFDAGKIELRINVTVPKGVSMTSVEGMILNRWLFNKVWRVSPHKRYLYEFTKFDSLYSIVGVVANGGGKSIVDTILGTVDGGKKKFTIVGCEFLCKRVGECVIVNVRREKPHRHFKGDERINVVVPKGNYSELIDGRFFLKGPINVEIEPFSRDFGNLKNLMNVKREIFM
ncbi:hypothetical protein CANINC_000873 [Pichia inconspicua]|uniref:tRNA(Ile)-lysidine synthetase n=1 Tax=Pichia inconspicua TaxID=52247 RepID=A0A4V4NG42_9ASCO|nr:hypothetical protein CANINC_000873 [[Candida] inconspicua]